MVMETVVVDDGSVKFYGLRSAVHNAIPKMIEKKSFRDLHGKQVRTPY